MVLFEAHAAYGLRASPWAWSVHPQGQADHKLTAPLSPQFWLWPLQALTGAYNFDPQRCSWHFSSKKTQDIPPLLRDCPSLNSRFLHALPQIIITNIYRCLLCIGIVLSLIWICSFDLLTLYKVGLNIILILCRRKVKHRESN